MKNIIWVGISIVCSIYTISFAMYEIKEKRLTSGIFAIILSFCAIVLSVVRIL